MNRSRGAVGVVFLCLVLVGCDGGARGAAVPPSAGAQVPAPDPSPRSAQPSLPIVPPTVAKMTTLRARIAADPNSATALRDLGFVTLQRIRETADPSLYAQADEAFDRARHLAPDDPLVLLGIGGLQLGRHEFADALRTAHAVLAELPDLPEARAIEIDALVELGRYEDADRAATSLATLHPDIVSLPRLSYVRELQGDIDGAVEAMRAAANSPGLAAENTAYVTSLLGSLLVHAGDPVAARKAYEEALAVVPDHAPSIAGLGRLAVGRGDLADAIEHFKLASMILPLPEYVIALGEAHEASGNAPAAADSYALARAEIDLFEAAGTQVDLDLALFEADHGDATKALTLATDAYRRAPTIRAADAVAWALHRLGRDEEARPHAEEAVRLGSRDPLLRYHRGAILVALGDRSGGSDDLRRALESDPGFSATGAAEAREILGDVGR
jgi:tetratricopeptide (TPR) repeat protein